MARPSYYNDDLAPYLLKNVEGLDRLSETKGSGAYGAVYEVSLKGIPCIAKRLHEVLISKDVSRAERTAIQQAFRSECVLLSKLKHPNIVHFVGVHYGKDPNDLSLIMEKLHTDLGKFLEPTEPTDGRDIPISVKASILLDVVYGLDYMHTRSKPMLHRDLSANNILLTTSLQAKIADLGVSKLLDPKVYDRMTAKHTKAPGSQNYMPPEALKQNPVYGEKLDVFSFGHLALYTATQRFPKVYEVSITPAVYQQGIVQVLKRQKAIDEMGEDHPLYDMTVRCLRDRPEERPTTFKLVTQLKSLSSHHPMTYDDMVKAGGEDLGRNRHEINRLNSVVHRKEDQVQELTKEKKELSSRVEVL